MERLLNFRNILPYFKQAFFPCQENDFRPVFLQRQFLVYYAAIFLISKLILFPFYFLLPKTSFFAEVISSALIQLTNEERQIAGLEPLKENQVLSQAAMQKAQDMISKDYFSHTSPQGLTPWHWFKKSGYSYLSAGENLAIGFIDSEEVAKAWENSPSHRDNLLSPYYKEIGIAVVKGDFLGKETTLVVQFFATPKAKLQAPAPQVSPKAKPVVSPGPTPVFSPEPSPLVKQSPVLSPTPAGILGQEQSSQESPSLQPLTGEEKKGPGIPEEIALFGLNKYDKFASKTITFFLLFIALALTITLAINFLKRKPALELVLSLGVFIFMAFVSASSFLDKQAIINLIPHDLLIYGL